MSKYLLFAGDDYYPKGGAYDLVKSYSSVEEAINAHTPNKYQYDGGWANILDKDTLKIVKHFKRGLWSNKEIEN